MYSKHITVFSSDGVPFVVCTSARSLSQLGDAVNAELCFASMNTAAQLDKHGDFHRQSEGIDAYVFYDETPAAATPRLRPQLRVIQGGRRD